MKVLLSIKPEYADLIFNGKKRYEFRRRIYKDVRVNTVVVYATKPVGKVLGEFTIKKIHSDSPNLLWKRTKRQSGISEDFFSHYFDGREIAHAIEVKDVVRYRKPKDISDFLPSGVAPQSYAYINS